MATTAWSQQDEMLLEDSASPDVAEETTIKPDNSLPNIKLETLSGVYTTAFSSTDPPYLLSVHVQNDEIIIVDISQHLGFLKTVGYLSKAQTPQDMNISAYDRAFYGHLLAPQESDQFYVYAGYINPLLPPEQQAAPNNHLSTTYLSYTFGKRIFLDVHLYVSKQSGAAYKLTLWRDNGGAFQFPLGGYIKLF